MGSLGSGDDGLIGEGFEQLNLSIGEWANFGAPDQNRANCLVRGPEAITFLDRPFPALQKFIPFGQDVCERIKGSVPATGIGPWWAMRRSLSPST